MKLKTLLENDIKESANYKWAHVYQSYKNIFKQIVKFTPSSFINEFKTLLDETDEFYDSYAMEQIETRMSKLKVAITQYEKNKDTDTLEYEDERFFDAFAEAHEITSENIKEYFMNPMNFAPGYKSPTKIDIIEDFDNLVRKFYDMIDPKINTYLKEITSRREKEISIKHKNKRAELLKSISPEDIEAYKNKFGELLPLRIEEAINIWVDNIKKSQKKIFGNDSRPTPTKIGRAILSQIFGEKNNDRILEIDSPSDFIKLSKMINGTKSTLCILTAYLTWSENVSKKNILNELDKALNFTIDKSEKIHDILFYPTLKSSYDVEVYKMYKDKIDKVIEELK